MIEILKFVYNLFKEAGIPIAVMLYAGFTLYLFSKYLQAKYGLKPFWETKQQDTADKITINVAGHEQQDADRRQFITPAICKSYRKETDAQLEDIKGTLNRIEGSTSVIEKLVLNGGHRG